MFIAMFIFPVIQSIILGVRFIDICRHIGRIWQSISLLYKMYFDPTWRKYLCYMAGNCLHNTNMQAEDCQFWLKRWVMNINCLSVQNVLSHTELCETMTVFFYLEIFSLGIFCLPGEAGMKKKFDYTSNFSQSKTEISSKKKNNNSMQHSIQQR